MKKYILILALAIIAPLSFGQDHPEHKKKEHVEMTAEQKAQKRVDKLAEKLELTDAQKEKIYKIELDNIKKAEKTHKEMIALREKAKQQREEGRAKVEAELTQEQKDKLAEMKAKRKEACKADCKEKCKGHKEGGHKPHGEAHQH
ncbi:hypothetical protein SAMN05216474_2055 [Lishizhenia tianjinensis]|uniref:Heavy-metal resistance n=1 Tax=Lishizhenia tianjinensis TaxID=477690 RepID=A0A1I7AG01_9FLAO|nr:hypothetical protein [Lishizhenia tianjinensis]SFT73871.1 hypothetical protein SAMN05216474_2055 [Lishizhenia tianjinensis]